MRRARRLAATGATLIARGDLTIGIPSTRVLVLAGNLQENTEMRPADNLIEILIKFA
jgi:hypothetical protein